MKSFFLIILVIGVIAGVYYWLKQKEKTGLISGVVSDEADAQMEISPLGILASFLPKGITPFDVEASLQAKAKTAWIRYSTPFWEDWGWFDGGNPGWSVEGEWFEDKSLIIQRYREGEFG